MIKTNLKEGVPSYRWLQILIALAVFANLSPLFITVLGPDGALYASISKTMALSNDYVNLVAEGRDWLDKPHFPFWITAFSFEIFGVHGWSYKLPGIIFLLMGGWYTYLYGWKLYNKQAGLVAALILLTAEHILLSSNDVRAEPYLTGLIIGAVFHFVCLHENYRFRHLVLGSLFTACAVMTKGIFALLPIGGAIIGHLVLIGEWKQLLRLRWIGAILLSLVFIIPELYCLWLQFDIHPEKTVFGQNGVSGIRFFFWDSQFGRFFNTGPIKGKGDLSFFIHTTLWAFLPWSILLFIAIGQRFSKFRNRNLEWYSFFAAMPTFLLFSLSRFQLPHYMNIVFPFFAVLTADYLLKVKLSRKLERIFRLQTVLVILLFVAAFALQIIYEPARWGWLLLAGGVLGVITLTPRNNQLLSRRIITISAGGIIAINLYLFWILYPDLLRYQSGSEAAFIANRDYPDVPMVQFRHKYSYPLEFYLDAPLITIDTPGTRLGDTTLIPLPGIIIPDTSADLGRLTPPYLVYTPDVAVSDTSTAVAGAGSLGDKVVSVLPNFRISRLNGKFINKKRRLSQVEWYTLRLVED